MNAVVPVMIPAHVAPTDLVRPAEEMGLRNALMLIRIIAITAITDILSVNRAEGMVFVPDAEAYIKEIANGV